METPDTATGDRFGVICHPHPLYGGTLENKVVHTLARTFHEAGVPTIRFNFRGVGASEGTFDNAVGETEDALAVVAAGRERWPEAKLWLAGFSFGGVVAIRAAARARPERLITVAPAVTRIPLGELQMPDCPWLIVQGEDDDVVDPQGVLDWVSHLNPAPQVRLLPGVGHFFHGRLHELREQVSAFVSGG